jgi:hypothetical protein
MDCFAFFWVCFPVWLSSGLDSCIVNGLGFDMCAYLICVILLDLILLADTNFVAHKNRQNTQTIRWKSSMHRECNKKNKLEKISQDETSLAEGWYSLVQQSLWSSACSIPAKVKVLHDHGDDYNRALDICLQVVGRYTWKWPIDLSFSHTYIYIGDLCLCSQNP